MLNRLAHVLIGAAVVFLALRRQKTLAAVSAYTYLEYQKVERGVKLAENPHTKDEAYPEIKEFGYGLGLGLAAALADKHIRSHGGYRRLYRRCRHWARLIRASFGPAKSTGRRLNN